LTGSSLTPKTIGIVVVADLAERSWRVGGRGDHGHLAADQIGHQCRQAVVLSFQPVVLDRYVLPVDVAGFLEAFAERGRTERGAIGRPPVDQCDHRHSRLLCTRDHRQRGKRTAEKRHELAPPCMSRKQHIEE
jgi:hypothetical protein